MAHTPVVSSFIESVDHDGKALEVKFKNGKVYRHVAPATEHANMLAAESAGTYYNTFVRKFPLEAEQAEQPF